MRRTKEQKGITLIALIITIVVLMVLAAVAISAIKNDGIIGHAQNATNKFTEEQQKEQDMLNYYELVLSGKAWTQNGTKVTRGDVTLEVGDYLYYDSGTSVSKVGGWRVLGAEYGQLLVVSNGYVALKHLEGKDGYLNGPKELNSLCENYANENYATRARSIKVEDVNRITGYNPVVYRRDVQYETGKYGNVVSYKMNEAGTYVTFAGTDGVWIAADGTDVRAENETNTLFKKLDGKKLEKDEVVTVTSDYYGYNIRTLTESADGDTKGLETNSKAYGLIAPNYYYWFANNSTYARHGRVVYGMRMLVYDAPRMVGAQTMHQTQKENGTEGYEFGVRAVVYIDPDMSIEDKGMYDNIQAWGIKE